MILTIEREDGTKVSCTYHECIDALERGLRHHFLLTQWERDECLKAIERIRMNFVPKNTK